MPKAKADQVIVHRIELQETERQALEMVAASMTARNLGEGVGSIISPFLQMSATAGVVFGSVLGIAVAKGATEKALDLINPDGFGGVQTRIATSPWFIAWVADVQQRLKDL